MVQANYKILLSQTFVLQLSNTGRLINITCVCVYISIIHLRCIKEVFSDATVFIADFGLFLHHISSNSNPGMTLEEPSRLRDHNVLRSCLYQSKEKKCKDKKCSTPVNIEHFSN